MAVLEAGELLMGESGGLQRVGGEHRAGAAQSQARVANAPHLLAPGAGVAGAGQGGLKGDTD